jgi:hypothetical protein
MAKSKTGSKRMADEVTNQDDMLWDFAFDQVTALTNNLLKSQVLRLDQIMHVVDAFTNATRTAGYKQSLGRIDLAASLAACATDQIIEYCNSCSTSQ